jgi:D-alanyl-D-alanine carboxypeptidase
MFQPVHRSWFLARLLYCLVFVPIGWAPLCATDPGMESLDAAAQEAIQSAVAKDLVEYGGNQPVPGAVVGIWAPGKGSFVKGLGSSQLSPPSSMSVDDKFRIGSNTKTFVITVLLQLVQENRVNLDDAVTKFDLGVAIPNGQHITIRQLAQMRSGLLDLYALPAFQALDIKPQSSFDRRHWLQLALDQSPLFAPGTQYNYSNTNYILLGMIIEAVTTDAVERQIESRLLVPLLISP